MRRPQPGCSPASSPAGSPPEATRLGFTFETALAAPAPDVWAHATTFTGVNRELAPFARMTCPPSLRVLDATTVVPGQRIVRSWILAFGIVPVDYDDLTIVELGDMRFLERSSMGTQRLWEHERVVEARRGGGCTVRDRVRFEPRIALLGRLQLAVFRLVFANRHRRLAAIFGRAEP